MPNNNDVVPFALIGLHNNKFPCAQLLNVGQELPFNPLFIAASCVCLYEAFLKFVPECDQNKFEEDFKILFQKAIDDRHNYMSVIKSKEIDDEEV